MDIKDVIGVLSDICILAITLYTFYLTYISKNIRFVGKRIKRSIFFGDNVEIYVENKTLHPVTVQAANLLYKNEKDGLVHSIKVMNAKEPLVIEPWHVAKITTGNCTSIGGFNDLSYLLTRCVLLLNTVDGPIFVNIDKKTKFRLNKQEIKDCLLRSYSSNYTKYGEIVISDQVKFAIHIYNKDYTKEEIVYVLNNGLMSKTILGENNIPKILLNKEEIEKYIKSLVKDVEVKVVEIKQYF